MGIVPLCSNTGLVSDIAGFWSFRIDVVVSLPQQSSTAAAIAHGPRPMLCPRRGFTPGF
jgi:hypothetical protein